MKDKLIKISKYILLAVFWLSVWHIISSVVAREILVPSPSRTAEALLSLAETSKFWKAVGASLLRICAGFLMAIAAGSAGAVLSYRFKFFQFVTSPVLTLVRTIPVASFIILAKSLTSFTR